MGKIVSTVKKVFMNLLMGILASIAAVMIASILGLAKEPVQQKEYTEATKKVSTLKDEINNTSFDAEYKKTVTNKNKELADLENDIKNLESQINTYSK